MSPTRMILLSTLALALATEDTCLNVSVTRDDAPRDGEVLLETDEVPISASLSTVTTTQPVAARLLSTDVFSRPLLAISPPPGGWPTNEAINLILETNELDHSVAFVFTAVDEPSPPPPTLEVVGVDVTEWTPQQSYPLDCCARTRELTFEVDIGDTDVWASAELLGRFSFSDPDPIGRDPVASHLDLQQGQARLTLRATQWLDDVDGVQPPCFDVVGRSAAGERGTPVQVCARDDGPAVIDGRQSGGCHTVALGAAGLWSGLGLLAVRRRRLPR